MNQVFNIHYLVILQNLYDFTFIILFCKWRNQRSAKRNYLVKVTSLVNDEARNKAMFFLLAYGDSQ